MRNKSIIVSVIIVFSFISYYLYTSNKLYGNDKESIVKVILSIEGYEDMEIELLEINDTKDDRIVGFLADNSPSYIEFNKDNKGNYVWRHIESSKDESFGIYILTKENPKMMFVTNYDNEIARMQVDVNDSTLEQTFTPYQATVRFLDLPKTNQNSYEYRNYKYYDTDGNLIREE
ncbi:hypothetical protein [Mangrovibacillus cuniculi]|uniref:Uncharacterized protein n=1 Tax=Mangrovibacillus cuniculi TaxID=2593652 RepID=A0A7S8C8X8_9BACI|nr:hypothetical protein [Mangrovibacillus cuniculi]QPC45585.1 hypothetical protein G8O30_00630 [Mangrovibacillus cuniculi]